METYIVDGSGFLFRAYHGLPPLTDDQGREIHVLYGFVSMMLTLLHDEPDLFVIARDAPSKTVRHDHFSGYKANRPKAPDDLKRQIQATQELVEKL
jgi:DNA polymerase-1